MSLVRWSTIINSPFTDDEEIRMLTMCMDLDTKLKKAQEKNPDAYLSAWYIFWYSASGDCQAPSKPENQLLAMWLAGEERMPVEDYVTVKDMYERDDWSALGIEIRQKEVLRECVKRWLDLVNTRSNKE